MPRRITVPDDHQVLVLKNEDWRDLMAVMFLLRKSRRISTQDRNGIQATAGTVLLAMVESEEEAGNA